MYINLKLFFKALHTTLFRRTFSVRRWGIVLVFTLVFVVTWLFLTLGRMLDHVLFPGFRRQEIRDPIFIIATPRSGTTFLQNLLALDEERFAFLRLYQMIFPVIVYQRLFSIFGLVDRRCGAPLFRMLGWCEKKFFGAWDGMHAMGFNSPEEDEGLFIHTFVTEAIYLLFPYFDELPEAGFADRLPKRARRQLMQYYRSSLQRHLYANGPNKTLLSKSTGSLGRIESLLETFPDARFIHLVRHPYDVIASHVSVFYPTWRWHSPEIAKTSRESRAYAQLAVDWYKHVWHHRDAFEHERYLSVLYEDLVRDPVKIVADIYAHFHLTIDPVFAARLAQAAGDATVYKSNHRYSLEEYGLSKEWIQQELGEVFDTYCFER